MQYVAYLVEVLCPKRDQLPKWTGKIDPSLWPQLIDKCKARSLRQVAEEYGVSHEAVRRVLGIQTRRGQRGLMPSPGNSRGTGHYAPSSVVQTSH